MIIKRILPLFVFVVFAVALSVAVMLLWNALMPTIFGLATLSYWQALGLFVLCRILFGRFGGGFGRGKNREHWHKQHSPFREKWNKMTPEEQEAFIRKRHEKFAKFGRHPFNRPFPGHTPETDEKG